MRSRLPLLAVALLAAVVAAVPAQPPGDAPGRGQMHRDGFAGRQPVWRPGGANVSYTVKDHRIATDRYYNAPASEYLKIEAQPGAGKADAEFVHFVYDTPKCPVSPGPGEQASARLMVRSFRAGIQLRARVRLPKERDPENPEAELAAYVVGESYPEERVRSWHPLTLGNPAEALQKQLPVLRLRLKRDVDSTGAYIDQLILNVYAGPGPTEVWIDDLDLGPCLPEPKKPGRPTALTKTPGVPPGANAPGSPEQDAAHPYKVEFAGGRILIDKKPVFMRAIRHTGAPLKELRDANFNAVALPPDAPPEVIDEAIRHNFLIVAGTPLASDTSAVGTAERDADKLAADFRRFRQGDGVLMWNLGGGRTAEQFRAVSRTADALREYDPRRPRAVDLWDGYTVYADQFDVIGAHRFPLFTGLELTAYRDWLRERMALAGPGKLMWTWVQTHAPEWYVSLASGGRQPPADAPNGGLTPPARPAHAPLGPTPEQIRLLTYLSVACGCRGLGFWSDEYLTNPTFGRDRLLELFQLNCELELLEPMLFAAQDDATTWERTSHGHVMAAVIRGKKGILVLPVWLGPGSQCCPDQGAVDNLTIKVPMVPEGADPWLLTPASYENLRVSGGVKSVPGGTQVTIPKFDLTAAIVFTADHSPTGDLVRWQENIRNRFARPAARYAREQAVETLDKTLAVHQQLVAAGAPAVPGAEELFAQARKLVRRAEWALENGQSDEAYRQARAALRPLRVVMREHWRLAAGGLTNPTASPFAVSFHTLPQHYELARRVQAGRFGPSRLPHGGFELSEPAPEAGAAVRSLPGWDARESHLDPVVPTAAVVNVTDKIKKLGTPPPKQPRPGDPILPARPQPPLGKHCLFLAIGAKRPAGVKPEDFLPPQALERAAVAVDSPAVSAEPGAWVRVSFWANVPGVNASADGAVVFDSAGGEPLGVRLRQTDGWRQYHLYRQVGADGQIRVTFALTGLGSAYFDDVRIEPLGDGAEVETTPRATRQGVLTGRGR